MIEIIAFKGRGGSGKSTAAKYVVSKGYVKTSFATPIRAMMAAIGCTEAELVGALKEKPSATLSGRSPREAMQLLGTEWGRHLSESFWTNLWRSHAEMILDQGGHGVVVDDCRFPNEADVVRAMGGYVIEIIGPESVTDVGIPGHASELQDFDPDITIINDLHDLAAFHASIDEALAVLTSEIEDDRAA